MILPLYTIMVKIDDSLIEAAEDLGAGLFHKVTKVLLPLSLPGITTGITMVFVPSISTFIISRMLGGGSNPVSYTHLGAGIRPAGQGGRGQSRR